MDRPFARSEVRVNFGAETATVTRRLDRRDEGEAADDMGVDEASLIGCSDGLYLSNRTGDLDRDGSGRLLRPRRTGVVSGAGSTVATNQIMRMLVIENDMRSMSIQTCFVSVVTVLWPFTGSQF